MKGMYVGVPDAIARVERMGAALGAPVRVSRRHHPGVGDVVVAHHAADWPDEPFHEAPGVFAAASGWFVFRGKRNDLAAFAAALAEAAPDERDAVVREIEGGAFLLLVALPGARLIVTDPFGLHPHYWRPAEGLGVLAPQLAPLAGSGEVDPLLARVLEKTNYLFANLTPFSGVERIPPGSIVEDRVVRGWFRYHGEPGAEEEIVDRVRGVVDWFQDRPRLLPLSGGLDSRLILAAGRFREGYTYGPPRTGDRPVGRRFATEFERYREFSLTEVEYPEQVRAAGREIFEGLCPRPFLELLAVLRWIREWTGPDRVYFDGYAGDVLQRGLYLTHGGARGAIAKLFPDLTLRRFDPEAVLRRKYPTLEGDEVDVLLTAFREARRSWDLDPHHEVVLFDLLHGRGARYVLNGGGIMAGQYFTVVQPFLQPQVFAALFSSSAADWLRYRVVNRVWGRVPDGYADVRTYSGFSPRWNGDLARATMLATKALGHLGVYPRAWGYERELPSIRWR